MRLYFGSAWLLLIVIGLLGVLPDAADPRILFAEGPLASATECDDTGEPEQPAETASPTASPASIPARRRSDSENALMTRHSEAVSSHRLEISGTSSLSGTSTVRTHTPLRL